MKSYMIHATKEKIGDWKSQKVEVIYITFYHTSFM